MEPPRQPRQEQMPPVHEIVEVAPGILRAQLDLSMPGLGHVNCYLIPDKHGVTVVDPGMPGPASWQNLMDKLQLAEVPVPRVHTVLVTHNHPDHFGNSGRLAKQSGAQLIAHSAFRTWWTPQPEDRCDDELYDVDPEDLPQESPFQDITPWGAVHERATGGRLRRLAHRAMMAGMQSAFVRPEPTRRVRNDEIIAIGGREWRAVHTPGHTLDHLCLWDEENGVFISGDHVLPSITPHISGLGAGRDPLKSYVESLDKVAALPGVKTVLPAHGLPFSDLPGRVDSIKVHHVERMEQLRSASLSLGPQTVTELSHQLFRPAVWGTMAESETFAHLEHLRLAGEAERHEEHGQLVYEVHPARSA